jgi:hypothetical protein
LTLRKKATEPNAHKKISGHNEYAAKACPGFQVGEWLAARKPVLTWQG